MMDQKIESLKLMVSGMAGALMAIFNVNHKYVTVLIILMILDTAFGWMKSFKLRSFESRIAKWGFMGKLVELLLVYILSLLDWAFNINSMLADIGVLYYGIVEIASIIENIHEGGLADLPPGLVELLRKLKYSASKTLVKKIHQAITSVLGLDKDPPDDEKQ